MRRFHRFALFTFYSTVLSCLTAPGCSGQDRPGPFDGNRDSFLLRGPYLSQVTQNSIVVAWMTTNPGPSAVQYGDRSASEFTTTDTSLSNRHSVTLTGLTEDRLYHYHVVAEADTGTDFTFRTAPARPVPFEFVGYGDTRTNHEAHVRVLKQIFKTSPRFIINTGDLVARNTATNWDDYFADLCRSTNVGQTIPAYSSPGNHDSGQMYYDNLWLPHNNPEETEAYYSFDFGGVHIVSVNTETSYDTGSTQYRWLVGDLESPASRSAEFRLAFWHRPPYSSGSGHGSDMDARRVLAPLMGKYGVDIVLNGHDHIYERTVPIDGTTYIVTGGGGAPLYNFKTSNDWTAYKEKTYHFCLISVDSLAMTVRMIRDDGTKGDSVTVARRPTPVEESGKK